MGLLDTEEEKVVFNMPSMCRQRMLQKSLVEWSMYEAVSSLLAKPLIVRSNPAGVLHSGWLAFFK
jgi:hypothetical protein